MVSGFFKALGGLILWLGPHARSAISMVAWIRGTAPWETKHEHHSKQAAALFVAWW